MSDQILTLHIDALRSNEPIANAHIRISCFVSATEMDAPISFDEAVEGWTSCSAQVDHTKTNEYFNRLQEAIINGQSIFDLFQYDGISLWQFLPHHIWERSVRAIELVDVLQSIVHAHTPTRIRVLPVADVTAPIWLGITQSVAESHGIACEVIPPNGASGDDIPRVTPPSLSQRLRMLIRRSPLFPVMRWLYHSFRIHRNAMRAKQNRRIGKTLVIATLGRRHWVRQSGESLIYHDEQCSPLMTPLRAAGWSRLMMIDQQSSPERELQTRNSDGIEWRPMSLYWPRDGRWLTEIQRQFAQRAASLLTTPDFVCLFKYNKVSLLPALSEILLEGISRYLPECIRTLKTAEYLLQVEQPAAVIITYEVGLEGRALVIQAHRAGIPTIGLQHGAIFFNHSDYMHNRIIPDARISTAGFNVPTLTCVWGPFWHRVLTDVGHYPTNAVAVTGNWRYDSMGIDTSADVKQNLKAEFSILAEKKLVVVLSSGQDVINFLHHSLTAIETDPSCAPIIKLHPIDNIFSIKQGLLELGHAHLQFLSNRLNDALFAADLVISQWSTVVAEAVIADVPVVLVHFSRMPGAEDFVNAGICRLVEYPHQLASAIAGCLSDESLRSKMKGARQTFIRNMFFTLDGQAACRVADEVARICDRKGR